jgi:hypothetical protein
MLRMAPDGCIDEASFSRGAALHQSEVAPTQRAVAQLLGEMAMAAVVLGDEQEPRGEIGCTRSSMTIINYHGRPRPVITEYG